MPHQEGTARTEGRLSGQEQTLTDKTTTHAHTQQLLLHLVQLVLFNCSRVKGSSIATLDAIYLNRGLETKSGKGGKEEDS